MRAMPGHMPARYGMNEYKIIVGDLTRRVESLTGNGRNTPRADPGVHSPDRFPVNTVASEFFEDY